MRIETGIAEKGIDLTAGASAFMRSAIESRLQEIESQKENIKDSEKTLLKALSINAIPELDANQRIRYEEKIEAYRKEIIDLYKSKGGELTLADKRNIQDRFIELQGNQKKELTDLNQFRKLQDKMTNPQFANTYDVSKYSEVMKNAYYRLMKGEGLGNINAELHQALLPVDPVDYAFKMFGKEISDLNKDTSAVGSRKGNMYTEEIASGMMSPSGEQRANILKEKILESPNIKSTYTDKDGNVDELVLADISNRIDGILGSKTTKIKEEKITDRTSNRRASDVTATFKDFEIGGENFRAVSIQGTPKSYPLTSAINTETGEKVDLSGKSTKGKIIAIDPFASVGFVEVDKGGAITKNGEQLYGSENMTESGKKFGKTLDQIKNDDNAFKSKLKAGEVLIDKDVTENEDRTITVRMQVEVPEVKNRRGKVKKEAKRRDIEFTVVPFTGNKPLVYKVDLTNRQEEFDKYLDSYFIDNRPLRSYIGDNSTQQNTTTKKNKLSLKRFRK